MPYTLVHSGTSKIRLLGECISSQLCKNSLKESLQKQDRSHLWKAPFFINCILVLTASVSVPQPQTSRGEVLGEQYEVVWLESCQCRVSKGLFSQCRWEKVNKKLATNSTVFHLFSCLACNTPPTQKKNNSQQKQLRQRDRGWGKEQVKKVKS